jgi:hypothetical protein
MSGLIVLPLSLVALAGVYLPPGREVRQDAGPNRFEPSRGPVEEM